LLEAFIWEEVTTETLSQGAVQTWNTCQYIWICEWWLGRSCQLL